MINFERIATVAIGKPGENGVLIQDNRIQFRVLKTDKPETNSMAVTVYNLKESSRQLFETTQNRVVLSCGYAGGQVLQVAVGDISYGITEYMHPDVLSTAECGDGLVKLRESRVSLSYASSVGVQQVIADIAKAMGLKQRPTLAPLNGRYQNGWSYVGGAKAALEQVTNRFDLEWSVQSEELQIVERRKPATREIILINPSTGMIRSPKRKDQTETERKKNKQPPGIEVELLLNPAIEPGAIVALESRDIDRAQYRVRTVEHRGDTRGPEWTTTLDVVEL